ncbi:hypothetical protein ZEAMMB73_Zm00001d014340 [Zea mays]|nr:hypothetical protein ZEAMMB73_Zm00001d014340 [Zea mays]
MCAGNGFREYQPKGLNPPNGNQFGFMVAPSQEQMLYQQKVHAPPYSSPFMGFHNHPLAVPTNGYLPYTQPGHFYPASMTPVGYGVAGDQCVDFSMQYRNNIHPYSGPEFGFLPSQPVHKTSVNFHAVPVTPLTPLCSRGMPVATNQERQQSPALFPKLKQAVLVPETVCAGDNTFKQKGDDVDSTPFSLFQFNLPIAPPTLATSKERSGELAPAQIARVQPCSREETNVKEYNIFSGCDGVMFQLN